MYYNQFALAPVLVLLAAGAWAQQPPAPIVGATAQVEGLVTVSIGSTVANVSNESPILDGSRFVTSSSGRATLRFKDGCIVNLGPNQTFDVDSSTDCSKRIAAVKFIDVNVAGTGLLSDGRGAGFAAVLLFAAGAAAASASGGSSGGGGPVGGVLPISPLP